jgi:uncharacterized membrane protein
LNILLVHALRVVHILGASFWVGAALLNVGFLVPAVRAAGPAGAQVMRHIVQVRRLPVFVNAAAVLTVLTGTWLYWWRSGGFMGAWLTSPSGIAFGVGGVLALVAAVNGYFVIGRTVARLGVLMATGEMTPEAGRLQARLAAASLVGVALVVVSALLMALARYL